MNDETRIQNEILIDLSAAGCLAWRNHVGKFRAMNNPAQIITIGTPGAADIIAVVPVTITPDMVGQVIGRAVAIEVKTATGKQQQGQKLWQLAIEKRAGAYRIARSRDNVSEILQSVRANMRPKF